MLNRIQPTAYMREIAAGYKFGSKGERYPDVDYDKVYSKEELEDFYKLFELKISELPTEHNPYKVIYLNPCYSD